MNTQAGVDADVAWQLQPTTTARLLLQHQVHPNNRIYTNSASGSTAA
jgi:hypothetical protein